MSQTRGYQANPLIGVAGSGQVDNTTIGFFETTPITQQQSTVMPDLNDAAIRADLETLKTALEAYGLFSDAPPE